MTEKAKRSRRFHRRDAAARYLRDQWAQPSSTKTLAKLACQGGGPPMSYIGRFPVYEEADLDAYALNRMRGPFGSTTEALAARNEAVGRIANEHLATGDFETETTRADECLAATGNAGATTSRQAQTARGGHR